MCVFGEPGGCFCRVRDNLCVPRAVLREESVGLHKTNLNILDEYPPHFMNGETEAQRRRMACPTGT